MDDVTADLAWALEEIELKARPQHELWDYFRGEAPKKWLTRRLEKIFKDCAESIGNDNWVEVAVNEPTQRLHVVDWASSDPDYEPEQAPLIEGAPNPITGEPSYEPDPAFKPTPVGAGFEALVRASKLDREEDDLYRSVGVVNEAFVFASKETIGGEVKLTLVKAHEVAWPEDVNSDPRVVARVWKDVETFTWRATLWYRDGRVVRFVGPSYRRQDKSLPAYDRFVLDVESTEGLTHGFERVPVVRFNGPKARSLAGTVTANQDRINKLTANKMVASEFAAFPQRYFLTNQKLTSESIEASPQTAVVLKPGVTSEGSNGASFAPTSVGTFPAADLSNYDDAISQELYKLFARAALPKHLMADSASGMSAKAIRADEAPLKNLVRAMQEEMDPSWEDLAELAGFPMLKPVWRAVDTEDTETTYATVKVATDAGMPLDVALKYIAEWDEEQLLELEKPETFSQTVDGLTKLGLAAQAGGLDPKVALEVGKRKLVPDAPVAPVPPVE